MTIDTRVFAVYFKLVAAAVVINFFLYPFYGPNDAGELENLGVWHTIDWFMAAAILLAIYTTYRRKAAESDNCNASGMFVFAVAIGIAFFPNWFAISSGTDNYTIWHLIDVALPIMLWTEGPPLEGQRSELTPQTTAKTTGSPQRLLRTPSHLLGLQVFRFGWRH